MEFYITSGQDADIRRAEPMLDDIDPDIFLADKAYDADRLFDRQKVTGQHQGKPVLSITGNETLLIYYPIKSTGFSLLQHVAINWNQPSSRSCVSSRSLFCLAASHVRSGFRYDQDRICFWPSQNPSSILQRVPSTFTSLCMVVPFGNHVVKYYVLSLLAKFRRISRPRVHGFGLEQSNSSAFRSAIGRYVQS